MSNILIYFIFIVSASLSCVTARNLDGQKYGDKATNKLQSGSISQPVTASRPSGCGEGGINIGSDCNTGSVTLIDESGHVGGSVPEASNRDNQRHNLNDRHDSRRDQVNSGSPSQSGSVPSNYYINRPTVVSDPRRGVTYMYRSNGVNRRVNIGAGNTGTVTINGESLPDVNKIVLSPSYNRRRTDINGQDNVLIGSSDNSESITIRRGNQNIVIGPGNNSGRVVVRGINGDRPGSVTIGSGSRGGDPVMINGRDCRQGGINVGSNCNSESLTVIDDSGYRMQRNGNPSGSYNRGVTIRGDNRRTDGVIVRYGSNGEGLSVSSNGASNGINIGSSSNTRNVIIQEGNSRPYKETNVGYGTYSGRVPTGSRYGSGFESINVGSGNSRSVNFYEGRGSEATSLNVGSGSNSRGVTIRGNGYSTRTINVGSGHNSGNVVLTD